MTSKITGGATDFLYSTIFLGKYKVDYFKCVETGFVQTEEPFWLEEAYSSAITKLDVGLVLRNELLREKTIKLIRDHLNWDGKFLDYAGGYGLFTRMMRDRGYDFYHTDLYCENIFAEYFDLAGVDEKNNFELVTAFEMLEHLVDPIEEIKKILAYSDNFLFTTEIQPDNIIDNKDWFYLSPETGQHISLYTIESLRYIAKKLDYYFYSDSRSTHFFAKKELKSDPFIVVNERLPFLIRKMKKKVDYYYLDKDLKRESLIHHDWQFIKDRLK